MRKTATAKIAGVLPALTIEALCSEATKFRLIESEHREPTLFGSTDGKAIGTYLEQKFCRQIYNCYDAFRGNSAKGLDLPSIQTDIKVTSANQPQSSSPFTAARQKIYGLGYSLLVFVYDKIDYHEEKTSRLNITQAFFIEASRTGDFSLTKIIRQTLENGGNDADLIACMTDRHLPVDDLGAQSVVRELRKNKPEQGLLTISNALQWRLQYSRIVESKVPLPGVVKL